jgi:hypothetical protein
LPEAIQYFKKAAQSVGQSAISRLLRLRLAMTERKKSYQSFNPINLGSDNFFAKKISGSQEICCMDLAVL